MIYRTISLVASGAGGPAQRRYRVQLVKSGGPVHPVRRAPGNQHHRKPMDPHTLLPHRYPFLLLDTIHDVHIGKSARGTKLVTGSEWQIVGTSAAHGRRSMPHLLIVEALAQLSAAVMQGLLDGSEGAVGYFMGINRARFRGAAAPGDVLALYVELLQFRRGICKTRGVATVDGTRVVRVDITSIVRPSGSS